MCSERGDASEIEVTPEMTEAGAEHVLGFDPDRESLMKRGRVQTSCPDVEEQYKTLQRVHTGSVPSLRLRHYDRSRFRRR